MIFTKMHGAGNDYVYLDVTKGPFPADPGALAKKLSDRHFGIGSDGLVFIGPSKKADFQMRMFNADGSEAQMCGNAIRCVGKYVYDHGLTRRMEVTVETLAGIKVLDLFPGEDGKIKRVRVDMGEPVFKPALIPVDAEGEECFGKVIRSDDRDWAIHCVGMGNPHAVILVDDAMNFPVQKYGPALEVHPVFPQRCNIEFATVKDRARIDMRVWERGAGETWACGTGACATAVACMKLGLCDRRADVHLLGGVLTIEWRDNNHIFMTGPAVEVFTGEICV